MSNTTTTTTTTTQQHNNTQQHTTHRSHFGSSFTVRRQYNLRTEAEAQVQTFASTKPPVVLIIGMPSEVVLPILQLVHCREQQALRKAQKSGRVSCATPCTWIRESKSAESALHQERNVQATTQPTARTGQSSSRTNKATKQKTQPTNCGISSKL